VGYAQEGMFKQRWDMEVLMIKFFLGMFICYVLVSIFGMGVFSDIWDGMMNIFNNFKEVNINE
tara:strand:- start:154 stop:342 length:189 start_codon:yes stop_codon:yes gene_type:complete